VSAQLPDPQARWPRVLFGILLLAITFTAYRIPYYDWDLVAYTGAAIALHEQGGKAVQTQAYDALRSELPEDDYADIAHGSDFRTDVAGNADHFIQQLRFYQIRPLYIRILAAMHWLGIGYVKATRLLSTSSFALIGVLSFLWARRYIEERAAAVCIPLLLIAPVLFTSARTGSPDALSAFLVLLGIFEVMEDKRLIVGIGLLLLSLFLRTDNVIFVFLVSTAFAAIWRTRRERAIAIASAILGIALVLGINHIERTYSWSVLMQNSSNPIVNPAEINPKFSFRDYFPALHDMVDEARETSVMVFPFIAAVALFSSRTPMRLKQLVGIVLLSWVAHIVLFPHLEDRYFVVGSAVIGIAAVCAATIPSPNTDAS
jgi:hypothetical protein